MNPRQKNDFSIPYYRALWPNVTIAPKYRAKVRAATKRILKNRKRYEKVEALIGIPWWFIAALHERESTCNFRKHLHNGDPLNRPTVNAPAGRGPFDSWEESAVDAIRIKNFHRRTRWTIADCMRRAEYLWNGDGYGKNATKGRPIHSPFLVAATTDALYGGGKYDRDGHYNPGLRDKQVGCAAIWRDMAEQGIIDVSAGARPAKPKIVLRRRKPTDTIERAHVEHYQDLLNRDHGAGLKPDGWAGVRTSTATKAFFGHFLCGDEREGVQ